MANDEQPKQASASSVGPPAPRQASIASSSGSRQPARRSGDAIAHNMGPLSPRIAGFRTREESIMQDESTPEAESSGSPLMAPLTRPVLGQRSVKSIDSMDAATGAPVAVDADAALSQNVHAHQLAHTLAQKQLHHLGTQKRLEHRLAGVANGHTLMNVSRQIQSRLKADFENAGMAQPDSFFEIDGEVLECEVSSETDQAHGSIWVDGSVHFKVMSTDSLPSQDVVMTNSDYEQGHRRPSGEIASTSTYHLESFNQAIRDETIQALVPADQEIPWCECKRACQFRQHTDDPDSYMWVCSLSACMYFSAFNLSGKPWGGVESENVILANLFKQPEKQEVDAFWEEVVEIMAFPNSHTQTLLIGHAPVRKCVCGVPCSIVVGEKKT